MTSKERFLDIVHKNIKREGIDKLLNFLEKTDFYTAPASTRFHDAYEGGLLEHSLRVYDRLKELASYYLITDFTTEETLAIVALFHDLCKVDCYTIEKKWRKNENNEWEQYDTYKFDEKRHYGGHGSKSVFIVNVYMRLSFEEATAINCHMGFDGSNNDYSVGDAFRTYPLAYLLHVADMMSTIPFFNTEEIPFDEAPMFNK